MFKSGMHSKQKGNIAQSLVVLRLQENLFNVFVEVGDYSKIDIIAEKNGILKRIQVKYAQPENRSPGTCKLHLIKSGPNGYRYTYSATDCDWFVIFNPETMDLYWIEAQLACQRRSVITIRYLDSKNKQQRSILLAKDFGIERFLRNFTLSTTQVYFDSNDKTQTIAE